ncbi:MAG: DNA gyrase inhibitor YacG [Hyphomicrobiales bacterium]|nr:DNA gyrase inhibitor YacG [Hyphomicrobiales bacterium]
MDQKAPVSRPKVKPCPICARPTEPAWKPFCSKRCADADLANWLKGAYAVPVVEDNAAPDRDAGSAAER